MIFTHAEELGYTIGKHFSDYHTTVINMVHHVQDDMTAKLYFNAGYGVGEVAVKLIGEAPQMIEPEMIASNGITVHEVNYLLAGLIYGLTEQNHLTELETCYTGGSEMENEIMTAIGDFKEGGWDNITQGCLEIILAALQLP